MRKLLMYFGVVFLFIFAIMFDGNAQTITPIYDIQYDPANPGGPSPLADQQVTIQGVVTVSRGEFSSSYFFIQDKDGAWNGLEVYLTGSVYRDSTIYEGDSLQVTGTVAEYHQMTQIGNVTSIIRLGTNKWINPVVITTAEVDTEDKYEGVLVRVENVTVVDTIVTDYSWEVDDGSGMAEIGVRADDNYFYHPVQNDLIHSITGVVMEYDTDYELQPRAAYDFGAINGITMIQTIQQVRASEDYAEIDTSYLEGDTVVVRGIVTAPSGLFYAGAGVTVYLQDKKGGPWSGTFAFAETPTGIDQLYEGDEVQVKVIVTEYEHESGVSMTELRGVEAFELISEFNPLPAPIVLPTVALDSTDMRDRMAEKYEGALIQLQNARVDSTYRWSGATRDFLLNDGSGGATWAQSRSDSLLGYEPPVGTMFQSVTGVIYHRFGSYYLLPRYPEDLILMTGPPVFSSVDYAPLVPIPEDTIRITASVQDDGQIVGVTLYYQQNGGGFQSEPMNYESGFIYSLNIGPFPDQTVVEYYVSAEDNEGNVATSPADAPASFYSFKVVKPQLELKTIAEAKIDSDNDFVPDLINSYVRVQGVVTGNRFADYYTNAYFQDKTAGVNLYVNGQFFKDLQVGDSIDVVGLVNHYNGLTEIQPDDTTKITILGKGKMPEPVTITCADLAETVGENYEGLLVMVRNVTVTGGTWPAAGANASITITDQTGSTTLRIDADTDIDGQPAPTGAFHVIGLISQYDSSPPQSSGYQILPRSMTDLTPATSVDKADNQSPLVFSLAQNFPNPFNPTTTIEYSIAKDCHVKLEIYNITGQKIKTLVDGYEKSGYRTVYWNGTNDSGQAIASGIYLYRIQAADFVKVNKMILMK